MIKAPLHFTGTANANLQNEINISIIFNYLREFGPTYRAKISKDLNISAPAVSRAVEKLAEKGYVIEEGEIKTPSGKKAAKISINLGKGCVVGIDLLKEQARFGILNFQGRLIKQYRGKRYAESTDVERDIIEELEYFLEDARKEGFEDAPVPDLKGICIGVPAVADIKRSALINAYLYKNLEKIDFIKSVGNHFDVPVYVENDVNLSAIAESEFGRGKDHASLVFVEVGGGIGAGIIMEGELLRGAFGAAGEMGFFCFDKMTLGTRRRKGFLERKASTESIRLRAVLGIKRGRKTRITELVEGDLKKISAAQVCQAALEGDPLSVEIIEDVARFLSLGVVNIILVLNPEVLVLGGDLISLPGIEELFLGPIIEYVERTLPFPPPEITISALGDNAGVIGAAHMAVETLLTGKYPYRLRKF